MASRKTNTTKATASKDQTANQDASEAKTDEDGQFIEVRTSNPGGRRRAGYKFGKDWKRIDVSDLDEEQERQLEADPALTIRPAQ